MLYGLGGCAETRADSDDLFQRVELLSASGAPQLALKILGSGQPPVEQTEDWVRAEQLRLGIYKQQGAWDALSDRIERMPAELPLIYQHRIVTHAVEILLQSGRGSQSRKYLRELIWRGSGDSIQISYWRRLLIQSYLLDGRLVDAQIAMDRYQKEYAPTDQNWSYLYGLTLLKSGSFAQAASQFSMVQNDRARALNGLSRLRSGVDKPDAVIKQSEALYQRVKQTDDKPIVMQRIWSLQAEAAGDAADKILRVKALEKLFSRPLLADAELPVEFTPADLWQAYRALGTDIGNRENLLVGDTEAWLSSAKKIKFKNKYGARAVYALLAMVAKGSGQKDRLHGEFYDILRRADLEYVAVSLYTDKSMFKTIGDTPPSVRHRIVRYAIQKREINLAAAMAQDLTTTYADQNPDEWKLIRARLAIYSGDLSGGGALLDQLVRSKVSLEEDLANRIMQLVFDLQSVDQYEQAYELLLIIRERVSSKIQKREIYFWMADSLKGMSQYPRAAELYIRSATSGGKDFDMWAQTARYHAAGALALAGMLADARAMYEGLLRVTTDSGRVNTIERKIQDLWLQEQGLD